MIREWQVLWVVDLGGGLFSVMYLLGGKEKRRAIVRDIFGLDKSMTEMGLYLASQPPYTRAPIGNADN